MYNTTPSEWTITRTHVHARHLTPRRVMSRQRGYVTLEIRWDNERHGHAITASYLYFTTRFNGSTEDRAQRATPLVGGGGFALLYA